MVSGIRLQKIIARSGRCSRREAERLIAEGRVTVNGHEAHLGQSADPETDHIKVDGKRIARAERLRHLLLYKPRRVMTTCDPDEERTTVIDIVGPAVRERVYPVGRLDYHSEGLLLLTNDGELASRIAHPRFGLVREYLVKVRGQLDERERGALMRGCTVDGRRVVPRSATPERVTRDGNSWWKVEVTEGRTHEVRELFFRVGHPVQRLRRTAIGPLRDNRLRPGDFRELSAREVDGLRSATRRSTGAPPAAGSRRGETGRGPKRR
jgi:23S rRNA pseudouridine2605 synthase